MEKESGVCSRELAQRLKKSGEKQKCLWYWQYNGEDHLLPEYTLECGRGYGISKKDCYAPTVAELGERLPARIIDNEGSEWFLEIWKVNPGKWEVKYRNGDCDFIIERGDRLANAMAKMLIYLLENKLIEEG